MFSAGDLLEIFGPQSEFYRNSPAYSQKNRSTNLTDNIKRCFFAWQKSLEPWVSPDTLTQENYFQYIYLYQTILACVEQSIADFNKRKSTLLGNTLTLNQISPLFSMPQFEWALSSELLAPFCQQLLQNSAKKASNSSVPCDYFQKLYQAIQSVADRQPMGEFYTPAVLAQKITQEVYQVGQNFLDPTCGSGVFLVEVFREIQNATALTAQEKIAAVQGIHGFDINALAIILSRANMLINLLESGDVDAEDIIAFVGIFIKNICLYSPIPIAERNELPNSFFATFNAVAGNPPWQVLNRIQNPAYKRQLKTIAKSFDLLPPANQITQLELSAIVLYSLKPYLRKNAHIGLVVSNAFIMGDNHVKTRIFHEFDSVRFWKFSQDIFRIHNSVFFAHFIPKLHRSQEELQKLLVPVITYSPKAPLGKQITGFSLELHSQEEYSPLVVEKAGESFLVKRLVPIETKKALIPLGKNAYYKKCFNGATIFPRNLIFLDLLPENPLLGNKKDSREFVKVTPQIRDPKAPWDFNPLSLLKVKANWIEIERYFLFQILKSECILPFVALPMPFAFLPIETNSESQQASGYKQCLDQNWRAIQYFNQLDQLYRQFIKKESVIKTLWENLDYQGKLTASRQRSPCRVVMMGSGTLVKACIIRDPDVIVDYTNFLIGLDNENEAYYLLGFLNSPELTRSVQIIQAEGAGGKGRHIQKRPFLFLWPKYDPNNSDHQQLVQHAQKMEKMAMDFMNTRRSVGLPNIVFKKPKSMVVQRELYSHLGWESVSAKKGVLISEDYQILNDIVNRIVYSKSLSSI
jgi:hypothetical protein